MFGLEGDAGDLGISVNKSAKGLTTKDGNCTASYGPNAWDQQTYSGQMCKMDAKYSASSDFYGDLTARFGYLMGSTLLYVKGGGAGLDADFKAKYACQNCKTLGVCGNGGPSTFNYDHSDLLVGWTAGAGR